MYRHPTLEEPAVAAILAQEYPRFTPGEYARRREALATLLQQAGCDHLLVCGEQRNGAGVQWLTGWPTSAEALVIFAPGEQDRMYVEWYNHWPLARRIATDADVRWGEHRGMDLAIEELARRGAKRVAVIGPLGIAKWRKLESRFETVEGNKAFVGLRLIKSAEELQWMRIGAALSDLGQKALVEELRIGMTERELANVVERAWVGHGGQTGLHYMGITPMAEPRLCVPRQHASPRKVQAGDVVVTEFTAHFWDYPGQVLRSYTVAADPTPLYRDLYRVAEAAFAAVTKVLRPGCTMQEILDAASVVEDAGFTINDDLLHGFGGGYFPPVLGSRSRPAGPIPDMVLRENMTVVLQPNVVTTDQQAGVQVGELVRITRDGCASMHAAERGFLRLAG